MDAGIIAYIHYDGSDSYANYVVIFNMNGELIGNVKYSNSSYAGYGDTVAVDANNNIFISGRWIDKILKLSSTGAQLLEVDANIPMVLALAPDGSVWNLEYDGGGDSIFIKRNPSTLAQEDSFNPSGVDYQGITFDSDGYLYTVDYVSEVIEKWDVSTHTRVAHRALAGGAETYPIYSSLAIVGTEITLLEWAARHTGDYFTCPTDLSSDFVAHDLAEFPGEHWAESVVAYNGSDYIMCGDIDVNAPEIEEGQTIIRYDSSFNVVWQIFYDAVNGGLSVSAYPFSVTAYDFPIYPVIFPLET